MHYFYEHIHKRKNLTIPWCGTDKLENYKSNTQFGPNLYTQNELEYKFNSDGFRCDEFTLPSDLNIVFLGCSCTEGIGLPIEQTWSYILLEKIKHKTKKNIPYWSLAVGGSGFDAQSENLYWLSQKTKIDFVFSFMPPFQRRDFCYSSNNLQMWTPMSYGHNKQIDQIFIDDDYSLHQTHRSLKLLDSVISANNATAYTTTWASPADDLEIQKYKNLNYFFSHILNIDIARDDLHPGPTYHSLLADAFWNKIQIHF